MPVLRSLESKIAGVVEGTFSRVFRSEVRPVEIARKLNLSPRTVETHRAHIHKKLDLATRAQLVGYALRRGLLGIRT